MEQTKSGPELGIGVDVEGIEVEAERAWEEHWVLRNHSDPGAELGQWHRCDVLD